jgi:molybdate transport system substrate-binding protein
MKLLVAILSASITAHAADLIVAAASDLAPLSDALARAFTAAPVKFTLASSGSLKQQIENGAPFDVFLSANDQYVKDLAKSGQVDASTVIVYATGRLALWSRDGSVKSLDDLKKPEVKHLAIPNPEHAPYGVAARQLLQNRKLWTQIEPKIVYGENVRQALQFAESGNADAVITSWTLLKGRGILLPDAWHQPIRQAGAVVKSSAQPVLAREFLKFLSSPNGRKILDSAGLTPHQP